MGDVGARWELGRAGGVGGVRKEKKCNCCASPARVRINNGRFKTSQKLIG